MAQIHPGHAGYRAARLLRGLRSVRGWRRVVDVMAPAGHDAPFRVSNDGVEFEGNVSSFVDRELYLFGRYEYDLIEMFVGMVPPDRRRVAIDVGANVGNHSLAFARRFADVHAFEPNPKLWPPFERNMALNAIGNVTLHRVGLGQKSGRFPFYLTEKANDGLGTFSNIDQYDVPLKEVGMLSLEIGDAYLEAHGIRDVDAVKIDTQGLEAEVIGGLDATLSRCRPVVWFELGIGTIDKFPTIADVKRLLPYPVELWRMDAVAHFMAFKFVKRRLDDAEPSHFGDLIAVPAA